MSGFGFACPTCREALDAVGPDEQRCPNDGTSYLRTGGIWRLLSPGRKNYFRQFMQEYETVRRAEGRGSGEAAYYRALPFQDLTELHSNNWKIRARSYQSLVDGLVKRLESERKRPLGIIDLGAGNCWLSYRLSQRGHRVAALDLLDGPMDGLGAWIHYGVPFTPIQAEFGHLPLGNGQLDMAVFNASLHYSTDYDATLAETLRVLRPDGCLAIIDSPVYHNPESGAQMVRERESQFMREHGFASNAIPSENYLTHERLDQLAASLRLRWKYIRPFYGFRWALRPWRARLRGHREPASFMVIIGMRE